ncbi:hypothetical protein HDU76_000765 [Blyttiomyces sp. JEL0837]|nr:hypothetical protein HDU76_000765 [Blyttiomyces sp. JEL0837]
MDRLRSALIRVWKEIHGVDIGVDIHVAITTAGRFIDKASLIRERCVGGELVDDELLESKKQVPPGSVERNPVTATSATRLHWILGFDTVVRLFDAKYYPLPDPASGSEDAAPVNIITHVANSLEPLFIEGGVVLCFPRSGMDEESRSSTENPLEVCRKYLTNDPVARNVCQRWNGGVEIVEEWSVDNQGGITDVVVISSTMGRSVVNEFWDNMGHCDMTNVNEEDEFNKLVKVLPVEVVMYIKDEEMYK